MLECVSLEQAMQLTTQFLQATNAKLEKVYALKAQITPPACLVTDASIDRLLIIALCLQAATEIRVK